MRRDLTDSQAATEYSMIPNDLETGNEASTAYPNALAGRPESVGRSDWRVLAALVLIALLPRVLNAVRQPCLCFDSLRYLEWSEALAAGRYDEALSYLNLNTYPVLLNAFRASGLDVVLLARAWSVLAASLVVLPLYGWVRRQFDARIAFLACLLYAVHDAFSADAPLIIRDSTCWLLMASSLYFAWRAAVEMRWWLFLAAGVSFSLAAYTRAEGWLLLVPIGGWMLARLRMLPGQRRRLAAGTVAAAAMVPLFLLLSNVTVLRGHDRWEWGEIPVFEQVTSRCVETFSVRDLPDSRVQATMTVSSPGETDAARLSPARLARKQGVRLVKTIGFVHALLLVLGVATWPRLCLRSDQLPVFLFAVLNVAAVGAIWLTGMFDRRYYLPLVMALLPWMALGLVSLSSFVFRRMPQRFRGRPSVALRNVTVGVCVLCVVLLVMHPRPFEEAQLADMGRWIRQTRGAGARVLWNDGRPDRLDYVEHYAVCAISEYDAPEDLRGEMADEPSVIVFWKYEKRPFWDPAPPADFRPYEATFHALQRRGFRRVATQCISPRCGRFVVLVRDDADGGSDHPPSHESATCRKAPTVRSNSSVSGPG